MDNVDYFASLGHFIFKRTIFIYDVNSALYYVPYKINET